MSEITITIQTTTNPSIIKFVSTSILINGGSFEFNNIDEAKESPLAQELFYLPFVKKVYITSNFIAIQKYDIVEWPDVQEEIREQIEVFLRSGNTVLKESAIKKQAIEVYAEVTPNPAVMKFGTNKSLTTTNIECKNIDEANTISPLAQALFHFPFVKEVFISENYVSITKFDMVEWNEIYPELRTFIRNYLQDNKTIIKDLPQEKEKVEPIVKTESTLAVDLDEASARIVSILDEYIKPAVASDGGNIAFESYDIESKIVRVILQGACSGCPSSTMTLKNGIETLLKDMMPNEIQEVVAING